MISKNPRIGFIGFGEVAYHFAKGLKEDGIQEIFAYDKNAKERTKGEIVRRRAREAGVQLVPRLRQLVGKSDVVFSAVWGSTALKVAGQCASLVKAGKFYCEINNTAPSVKTQGAEMLNAKGAKYVDLALFVAPDRDKHRSFMLASGDGARPLKRLMAPYGMDPEVVPGGAGRATTIKTLANIYYKGIQALCLELALSAWKVGIDPQWLAPLVIKAGRVHSERGGDGFLGHSGDCARREESGRTGKYHQGGESDRGDAAHAYLVVESWHDQPRFIEALADATAGALGRFPDPDGVRVVFSAHSLPRRVAAEGDAYPQELARTAALVAERLGLAGYEFAYQSAGRTGEPWLGPDLRDEIRRLADEGVRGIVVCPVGFVADHLEVLYDIDIEAAGVAREVGVRLERAPSMNDTPTFIAGLADVAVAALASTADGSRTAPVGVARQSG